MKESLKSIAVLPFINMSNNIDNEYFCDGLTEEIINALAKIKQLSVTSRTSSFYFKNQKITSKEVRKKLGISIFIEGSVRLSGNKMRITVQMIDAIEDYHFWSETFDRNFNDVFAVQDEISLFIAEKLREHIGHLEIEDKLVTPLNVPVNIYKEYLKGRYFLMKLDYENTLKAISIFEEIIKNEPNFPNPYLDINQGYTYLGAMGLISAFEGFQKAQPFLQKAIELNPNSSKFQLNLSWIACWQNWDLKKAFEHANKALELQPSDEIYLTLSNYLTVQGKLNTAHNYIDKALELDPYAAMNHDYKGFLYYLQEDYSKANRYFKKALELNKKLPFPHIYIGQILFLTGKPEQAVLYFESLENIQVTDLTQLGGLAMCYAVLKNEEEYTKKIIELEQFLQTEKIDKALNFLILTNVLLGNYIKALDYIEQAFKNHLPLILLLNTEPIIKPLRNKPRFKKIMLKAISDNKNYKTTKNYKQSLLNKEEVSLYANELKKIMIDYKLYLNPDLSLKDIASYLELPSNYVSQLLNLGFQKNFSEFTNTYRVNEFKQRIVLEENKGLTIMAVAYDSGFNSKTVFNTFFKKIEGLTPNAYLKKTLKK
ncbi:helix-turn-helix domain-containing protein [Polaribacter sp. Asnod6-C07]|uniref:helix-turn-helix domain-containing protein n=1 Tax=Polaribacter sp. Asnod6-C07 TaxID=3160582 RepID=UPI00386ED063